MNSMLASLNPFMDMQSPDFGGLAAVAAELLDALTADPNPPPGPSDADEIQAILTRLQAA